MSARMTSILLACSALTLLGSWFSILLFLGDHLRTMDFAALVQDPVWIPVNIVLLVATGLLVPGMTGLYANLRRNWKRISGLGLVTTQLGICWFACIQFYETFLWPLIAANSPELFEAVGFAATDPLVFWQMIASGVVWVAGFAMTGAMIIQSGRMKWTGAGFALGAILFGVGMALPIRTVGLVMFSAALLKVSVALGSPRGED